MFALLDLMLTFEAKGELELLQESGINASGFTLDIVRSVGLDKCIMGCIHHYGIIQSIFTALNPLCPTCSILPPATPWQLLFFLRLSS